MTSRCDRARAPQDAESTRRSKRLTLAASALAFGLLSFAGSAFAQGLPLTLDDALRRAAGADPRLRSAEAGLDAAEAGRVQARTRPNPVLDVEVENFAGTDRLRGLDGSETTFRLSQPIERGGRRQARITLAERELDAAGREALIRWLDVFEEVQRAYYDALAAEERVDIAAERLATAQALQRAVDRRVSAARDPLMAGARAAAGTGEAKIALERAQREAANARATLASFWGGDEAFALSDALLELPDAATHAHDQPTDGGPDVEKVEADRRRAAAAVQLERSRAFADPVLSLGWRRFEETDETGFVAGFSIPLGVRDRNRGGIARAQAEERRTVFDVEAARLRLKREGEVLARRLTSTAANIAAMDRDVIPPAQRALALARDGYNQGAFSYLDVLEAQRMLTSAREARVEALLTYHHTEAALDRLTARFAERREETSQ